MFKNAHALTLWLCLVASTLAAREPKESDRDVNYDESNVPAYVLPELLVTSEGDRVGAQEEWWADPRGEYLSAYHAGEVYRLLGESALESEATPPVGEPVMDSTVGYHIREGGHSIAPYDWTQFLNFADRHLKD